MANLQKPVGDTTTLTAVVKNLEGVVLPNAVVAFASTVGTPTVDPSNPDVATFVGTTVETVEFTATAGPAVSAPVDVDYVDNTPATVELTAV